MPWAVGRAKEGLVNPGAVRTDGEREGAGLSRALPVRLRWPFLPR